MSAIDILGYSISMLLLLSGVLLVLAEAVIPGAHFIVLGVALFITGLIGFLTPVGGSVVLLTATFIIISILTFLGYSRLDIYSSEGPTIGSSDSSDLVGVEGKVIDTVTQNSGKVDLEVTGFTTEYQAQTPHGEIPEGSRIIVTDGRGGSVVEVQSLEDEDVDNIDKELEKESATE